MVPFIVVSLCGAAKKVVHHIKAYQAARAVTEGAPEQQDFACIEVALTREQVEELRKAGLLPMIEQGMHLYPLVKNL